MTVGNTYATVSFTQYIKKEGVGGYNQDELNDLFKRTSYYQH